jgi:predicted Ser/Thr protein kinase
MSMGGVATMTAVKIKEISTSIFVKFARGFSKIDFLHRNRRVVFICLSIWIIASVVGFLIYQNTVDRTNKAFYQQGLSAAQRLAEKSGPFVLEKDILELNVAIKELDKLGDLKFAAVMNHKNTILTHTNTEMINSKFEPSKIKKAIETINGTTVTIEISPDKTELVGFTRDIMFSNVQIGKVHIALSAMRLHHSLGRLRLIYISGMILITLIFIAFLFWADRKAKSRALAVKRDLESMDRVGPYLLLKRVARGGMAELFLSDYVREDGFRRTVAVKRILPHLAENPDFIKMFTREARLAALLRHPNVVQIFDYGKIGNAYFIAMEYIDGKNLGEMLSILKQGLPVDNTVFIISEICKGLDYSHARRHDETGEPLNIVHRDISPQNLLISYQGEVKISDFGISKARSEPSFTQAGVIKGKLSYLSTEQALGEPVDSRADIYALGLVFHETLTGKRVFQFASDLEAIRAIPKMEIEPLSNARPDVPEELNRIVMKCLERDKDVRYQSAAELHADLETLRKGLKITFNASDLARFMKENFDKDDNSSNTQ